MPQTVWEAGRLTDVWMPVGVSDEGNVRFRRANFDILQWASVLNGAPDTYVVPLGTDRFPTSEVALKGTWQVGQEFGYYVKDSLYTETHQGDGQSDSVTALHNFGYV